MNEANLNRSADVGLSHTKTSIPAENAVEAIDAHPGGNCCGGWLLRFKPTVRGLGAAALLSIGFLAGIGGWTAFSTLTNGGVSALNAGIGNAGDGSVPQLDEATRQQLRDEAVASVLGQTRLHAAAASRTESFAVATGPIDKDVEGLFVLDFVSGDLQCIVMNWRTGKFDAVFRANVMADLGLDVAVKRPSYLMVAGSMNFIRGSGMVRPGNSVVYVLDASTGAFGAYGIPWRREAAATTRAQTGALTLLDIGRARTAPIRE